MSSPAHINFSKIFHTKGNMEIWRSIIRGKVWVTRFKKLNIFCCFKHSGKIPTDNELLKSIETELDIWGPDFFLYKYRIINEVSGFVLMPMDYILFFHNKGGGGGRKWIFHRCSIIFFTNFHCGQDWRLRMKNMF